MEFLFFVTMFRPSEYTSKSLWFAVPDEKGRSRAGVLCGIRWRGEWPISRELASVLLEDEPELQSLERRLRHPQRLSQSVLARFILKDLLARSGDACSEMSFSMTHSGTCAIVLGFEDDSCGVDLELGADESRQARVASKFISAQEQELVRLAGLSPWAIWCAKESLGKALGTGLKPPLSQYVMSALYGRALSFQNHPDYFSVAWDIRRSALAGESVHFALSIPGVEIRAQEELGRLPVLPWLQGLLEARDTVTPRSQF